MRYGVLVLAGLALAQPLPGQISADSAAIVALELEMSRLLAAGNVDEYATHLASDYARTTQQGKLEGREVALATWRARSAGVVMRPTELWVRVYGYAAVLTGVDTPRPLARTAYRSSTKEGARTQKERGEAWLVLNYSRIPQRDRSLRWRAWRQRSPS